MLLSCKLQLQSSHRKLFQRVLPGNWPLQELFLLAHWPNYELLFKTKCRNTLPLLCFNTKCKKTRTHYLALVIPCDMLPSTLQQLPTFGVISFLSSHYSGTIAISCRNQWANHPLERSNFYRKFFLLLLTLWTLDGGTTVTHNQPG